MAEETNHELNDDPAKASVPSGGEEQNLPTEQKPAPEKPKKSLLLAGIILVTVMLTCLSVFSWVFVLGAKRLERWVELDKQLFGFGHAPGELLSDNTIWLFQQSERFANPGILGLSMLFLVLVMCAPIPIFLRDRRVTIAGVWCLISAGLLLSGSAFFYYMAWYVPQMNYAQKYELSETPFAGRATKYVDRLRDANLEQEQAAELMSMLGWINECSQFKLNDRPEQAMDALVELAGDTSQQKLNRLMAAASLHRMMTPEEINGKLHFDVLKSAAESAKGLKGEIAERQLVILAKLTGAQTGSNLAFE